MKHRFHLYSLLIIVCPVFAQGKLSITDQKSGLTLSVTNEEYPLLKLLLPGQPAADRGIEIEFPEHVTGLNLQNKQVEHLYLVSRGSQNKRTKPSWTISRNTIMYQMVLDGGVQLRASAILDSVGVEYTYEFTNESGIGYDHFQAVTCVKLYSLFADTRLERFYVHDKNGFELLASETPERLSMPLEQWLPCRYLVSYDWPVPDTKKTRVLKDEDGITRYYKPVKADRPLIATLSQDKQWVAATYTRETGNMWTNPERSCQHADPEINLAPHAKGRLNLKTFVFKGDLNRLLKYLPVDLTQN